MLHTWKLKHNFVLIWFYKNREIVNIKSCWLWREKHKEGSNGHNVAIPRVYHWMRDYMEGQTSITKKPNRYFGQKIAKIPPDPPVLWHLRLNLLTYRKRASLRSLPFLFCFRRETVSFQVYPLVASHTLRLRFCWFLKIKITWNPQSD